MSKYVIEISAFIPLHELDKYLNSPIKGKAFDTFEEAQTHQRDWCYENEVKTSRFRVVRK